MSQLWVTCQLNEAEVWNWLKKLPEETPWI